MAWGHSATITSCFDTGRFIGFNEVRVFRCAWATGIVKRAIMDLPNFHCGMFAATLTLILAPGLCAGHVFASGSTSSVSANTSANSDDIPVRAKSVPWRGGIKETFRLNGRDCIVAVPQKPLPGNPWVWRPEFFGAFPKLDEALFDQGFHLAFISMPNLYGSPKALEIMDHFHAYLTTQRKPALAKTVVLEGVSRGGLHSLNWAAKRTDCVKFIVLDAAVCDFKSWPMKRSPADWARLKTAYGFKSDAEALAYRKNPIEIENLAPLAAAKIPIASIIGDADTAVTPDENGNLLEKR